MNRYLIEVRSIHGMSHVVVTIAVITLQVSWEGEQAFAIERLKSTIRTRVQTMAVCVIQLKTKTIAHLLLPCDLKRMIGAVSSRDKLRHGTKSRVQWCFERQGRKTSLAPLLVGVWGAHIEHLEPSCTLVFHGDTKVLSKLLLNSRTPLHAVGVFLTPSRGCIEINNG